MLNAAYHPGFLPSRQKLSDVISIRYLAKEDGAVNCWYVNHGRRQITTAGAILRNRFL